MQLALIVLLLSPPHIMRLFSLGVGWVEGAYIFKEWCMSSTYISPEWWDSYLVELIMRPDISNEVCFVKNGSNFVLDHLYSSPDAPSSCLLSRSSPGASHGEAGVLLYCYSSASALQFWFMLLLFELCAEQELNLQRLLITRSFCDVERQSRSFSLET